MGAEFLGGVHEDHYGKELAAKSVEGEEFTVPALVSSDILRVDDIQEIHHYSAYGRHHESAGGISYQQHASTDVSPTQ